MLRHHLITDVTRMMLFPSQWKMTILSGNKKYYLTMFIKKKKTDVVDPTLSPTFCAHEIISLSKTIIRMLLLIAWGMHAIERFSIVKPYQTIMTTTTYP